MSGEQGTTTTATFPPALVRLAGLRTWICWKWGPVLTGRKGGRRTAARGPDGAPILTKVPCDLGGRATSSADASIARTYAECFDAISHGLASGAALCAAANDGSWLAVDLDKCRNPETGAIADWAAGLVEASGSYAEASPSGTGLRIIGSAAGWSGEERQRRWWLGEDADRGGYGGRGETFFRSGFATVTFAALPGRESSWDDVGGLAASLPRRPEGPREAGRDGEGTAGKGRERKPGKAEAPADVVAETLAEIPNGGDQPRSWDRWNRIGMCAFRATGGSDEGLSAWTAWSARHPSHEEGDSCEARWEHWSSSSPPTRLGFGSLLKEARDARRLRGDGGWTGGDKWKAWRTGQSAAGLDRLPDATGTGPAPHDQGSGLRIGEPVRQDTDPGLHAGVSPAGATIPTIPIGLNPLHRLADMAEDALMSGGFPVYQRGPDLVVPSLQETETFDAEKTLSAQLVAVGRGRMADMLSKAAVWARWNEREKRYVACDPPPKVVDALLDRQGAWRVPAVTGVATLPPFRPDGTIAKDAGYDAATQTYVSPDPSLDFGRLTGRIEAEGTTKADAERGIGKLDSLLGEFPFLEPCDRSVALSCMLTPIARGMLDVAPLHAINAPEAGGGKTFLAALCASLALGRPPHVFTMGQDEAELEKRIGTALMAGMQVAVIDNVNGTLDGSFLCVAVEQRLIWVRVLGLSKRIEIANTTCFTATGNNIAPAGDALRRVLTCTLDPNVERPEFRRFSGNPRETLLKGREDFLVAAYGALRAHALAGCPGERMAAHPLASYGRWDRHVRGTLLWTGRADPVETMDRSRKMDPERADMREGTELLMERQRLWGRQSWTVAHLMALAGGAAAGPMGQAEHAGNERIARMPDEAAKDAANRAAVREWLLRIGGDRRGTIDSQRVGLWLRRHSGRVSGVLKLERSTASGDTERTATWKIVTTLQTVKRESES